MSQADHQPAYRVVKLAPGYDLTAFECGEPSYNDWLIRHAAASVSAGVCAVYLLLETTAQASRVVGYYAINPTQVVREELPRSLARGGPQTVPAWKLGKLAIHIDLRADKPAQWGRQLLRDALETIVRVADAGGGKVIVVDTDHPGLLDFYTRNGFKPTGIENDLTLYLKVSTARATLKPSQRHSEVRRPAPRSGSLDT
jgi:predicted GNAT family N-acyltransferase